ncbi:hypothetical protein BS78_05G166000 [Paspalum vaginatum]|nr:hypothetical protein BS78_05G166000 [Paspalum vaginatum]
MISWLDKIIGDTGRKGKSLKNQHSIPFRLLQRATDNFDKRRVIGRGGFGDVYMGEFADGTKVAIKRRDLMSKQGQNEFKTEIELLRGLDHSNLVSLIGYCDAKKEMILVYEYMEKGTLTSHLYGSGKHSLSWKQRLEVSVGIARGLNYLHTSSPKGIIHRDVKSANILLDDKLRAKVSDLGISKTGELDRTHVSTQVKGTSGYLDPQYFKTQQLTKKSDVYSFGAVLLEILCGRPVIDHGLPREKMNLVEWGMGMLKKGQLEEIVDQEISGTIEPRSLMLFGEIVAKCLAEDGAERPSMEDILRDLELELEYVHESITGAGSSSGESDHDVPSSSHSITPGGIKVLTRCLGRKGHMRTSNAHDDLLGPSTSRVCPVLDESISADGISDEDSDHDVSPRISSQAIKPGEGKALTRCAGKVYRRASDDDLPDR